MGFSKKGRSNEYSQDDLTVSEDDLSYFDAVRKPSMETAGVTELGNNSPSLPVLTEDDLAHLAPGCFVQVGCGDSAYWVEIGQIDGVMYSGMVHPELSSFLCLVDHDSCEIARFTRNQITALGCGRYCWCERIAVTRAKSIVLRPSYFFIPVSNPVL